MSTIARRISRLEARLLETEPPRLFVLTIGREPQGFTACAPVLCTTVDRLTGETLEELENRCTALHPGVIVWRAIGGDTDAP